MVTRNLGGEAELSVLAVADVVLPTTPCVKLKCLGYEGRDTGYQLDLGTAPDLLRRSSFYGRGARTSSVRK